MTKTIDYLCFKRVTAGLTISSKEYNNLKEGIAINVLILLQVK